jgi:hypothetical protein
VTAGLGSADRDEGKQEHRQRDAGTNNDGPEQYEANLNNGRSFALLDVDAKLLDRSFRPEIIVGQVTHAYIVRSIPSAITAALCSHNGAWSGNMHFGRMAPAVADSYLAPSHGARNK